MGEKLVVRPTKYTGTLVGMSSAAAPDRRAVRGQATRDRIIDAAREVLIERRARATRARARSPSERACGCRSSTTTSAASRACSSRCSSARTSSCSSASARCSPRPARWRRSGGSRATCSTRTSAPATCGCCGSCGRPGSPTAELAAGWRAATAGWRDLLAGVFAAWAEQLDIELPLSPRALASFTANLFQGIEVEMLAGRDRGRGAAPRSARRRRRADRAGGGARLSDALGAEFAQALAAKDTARLLELHAPRGRLPRAHAEPELGGEEPRRGDLDPARRVVRGQGRDRRTRGGWRATPSQIVSGSATGSA